MWTVLVVLYLWVVRCAVSSSIPSPVDVVFFSLNLKNVLHWSPGNGTPDDTHFTVKYAVYGDSVEDGKGKRVNWREVRHCMKTVHTWCDLSSETWDLEQGYYAKVRAVGRREFSKWTWTAMRFDPLSDTSFGPPLVSVTFKDKTAIITMEGPRRYQPGNHIPAISMATFYPHMTYNLSIQNTHRNQTHHFLVGTNTYTYQMMDYDTKYCFSAKTRVLDMPIHCHTSEWFCTTTPKDPVIKHLLTVIVGTVVPLLCICALLVVCYFLSNYLTGKGHKSPYILNPPSFHSSPLMLNTSENPNIILITIGSSLDTDPACTQQRHADFPDPPPRYSPPPELMESGDNTSLDYGVVAVAPQVDIAREKDWTELKGSCGQKEGRAEGGQGGFYSRQARPHLPVTSTPICTQSHSQAHPWTQLSSGLFTQTQTEINANPQTGRFNVPLNLKTNELRMRNDMEGKVRDAKFEEDADRGSKDEEVPLLSTYAFHMPFSDTDQFHFLADDNNSAADSVEEACGDTYNEAEDSVCINWDPDTRKLVVPGMAVDFQKQRGSDGEGDSRNVLRLENVFVRQSSEEAKEAEELRRMGTAGAPECDMVDFVTRWKLVIPADQ